MPTGIIDLYLGREDQATEQQADADCDSSTCDGRDCQHEE